MDEPIEQKRGRGRPKGSKTDKNRKIRMPNKREVITFPRTPFEALRFLLKLSITEWANLLDILHQYVMSYESGKTITPIPVAKRMQEEARKLGIAITLDELYQNVYPKGYEEEYRQDNFIKASILLKKGAEQRKATLDERKRKKQAIEQEKLNKRLAKSQSIE